MIVNLRHHRRADLPRWMPLRFLEHRARVCRSTGKLSRPFTFQPLFDRPATATSAATGFG
jgi:hypothetical protein